MPQAENCKCRYTVVVNMAGYLPNNEPECYRTKRDAQAGAKWWADDYRDDETRLVTGNARSGYTVGARNPTERPFTIPTYITVYDTCPDDAAHYCQCDDCQ